MIFLPTDQNGEEKITKMMGNDQATGSSTDGSQEEIPQYLFNSEILQLEFVPYQSSVKEISRVSHCTNWNHLTEKKSRT